MSVQLGNSILNLNVRGLHLAKDRTKHNQLGDFGKGEGALAMVVTETWLSANVLSAEVGIPGFHLHRSDRAERTRGGVAIYVRDDLTVLNSCSFSNSAVEFLVLKVRELKTVLVGVYRPPDTMAKEWEEALAALEEAVEVAQAHTSKYPSVVVAGDFNFPTIQWGQEYRPISRHLPGTQESSLLKFMSNLFLEQVVLAPTRLTSTSSNALDLVMSNSRSTFSKVKVSANLTFSDHCGVTAFLTTGLQRKVRLPPCNLYTSKVSTYALAKAEPEDWVKYHEVLQTKEWGEISSALSAEDKITALNREIEAALEQTIPPSKGKLPGNRIPKEARRLMLRKARISARLLRTRSGVALINLSDELREVERELSSLYLAGRRKKEEKVAGSISTDPGTFYKYAKSFSRDKSGVGPLLDKESNPVTDDSKMAEILSKQYCEMFSTPCHDVPPASPEDVLENDPRQGPPGPLGVVLTSPPAVLGGPPAPATAPVTACLETVTITNEAVQAAVNLLSSSAAPGPDGVAAVCIKKGGNFIIMALVDIFSQSLEEATAPDSMKQAFISPIWKGVERTLPSSYRPVALTNHYSKLLERVIRPVMVQHLEEIGALDESQHGARAGRSTLSQLLVQYQVVLHHLKDGENCDVVYLDFAKAFDKVDLGILLRKLRRLGIQGPLWKWLASFLLGRTQAVRVGDSLSSWETTISGVPQGSVLGPLLFLIFIADLGEDIPSSSSVTILKYVDDTKLVAPAKSMEDVEALQQHLDLYLYSWQARNNMEWNGQKFQILRMGANDALRNSTTLFTPGMGDPIQEFEQVKDLGVQMDAGANFHAQRSAAAAKTSQKAGWVLRTFVSREIPLLRTLWKSLVQPHLDYASQLWFPCLNARDQEEMEAPLRAYTRRMSGLKGLDYWERLVNSGLQSAERRAERYKILYLWKLAKGLVPNFGAECYQGVGRHGGLLFRIPPISGSRASVKTLMERSLPVEGPRLFNSLPAWARDTSVSKETFKVRLDSVLMQIPDQPRHKYHYPSPTNTLGRPSNSVRDWIPLLGLDKWVPDHLAAEAAL